MLKQCETRTPTMKTLVTSFMFLIILGLTAAFASAQSDQDNGLLLQQATTFFHQANESQDDDEQKKLYEKALLRYETVSKEIANGKLFYNIGNTYFMQGDIGRAIVNYRRAEQLIPDNEQLQQNLGLALEKRQDIIPVKQEDKLLHTLFFWHYDLSDRVRTIIFACAYTTFWLCAGLMLLTPLPIPRPLPIALLVLTMMFSTSLLADRFGAKEASGVIVAQKITARQGDGLNYQPSFTAPLHAGTEFTILEHRGKWLQVELHDGRQCWLPTGSSEHI